MKKSLSFLVDDIKCQCRRILIQFCKAEDIEILKDVVSKDHIHMHINFRPSESVSDIVRKLKGRSSRKPQQEFPELHKRYLVRHFWAMDVGVLVISQMIC